jgi:signal transduction histidine kinase
MVAQLLAVSRLEAGALQPQLDVVRVEPLVRRTWEALRSNRPFALTVSGEPHLAIADSDRLEQALWAILDNAIKYSPDGAPIEVMLRTNGVGGTLSSLIEIRDHGVGMDGESRKRAFEQFYRSTVARRMAPDGSGVGLYAAAGLIRLMSGALELESPPDGGTLARIRLPAEGLSAEAT